MGKWNRFASALGSSLEWFDFALYGYFGTIFAKIFFSANSQEHWVSLIETYAIFAIGFAARPIGALLFGYLGDKYGRTLPLKITPILITLVTIIIAFLPTYNDIGNAAILILILSRIVQGILLGGEFGGNIVYLCESSSKWQYFWGSIGSCTGSLGIILASLIASLFYKLFSQGFMYEYGWRIAYLFSIPLGTITFLVRLNITESPLFKPQLQKVNPLIESFKKHKVTFFSCLGLVCLHSTSFYFVFMFLPVFLNKIRHLTEAATLVNNTNFLILHLCLIPIFGLLVNITGGKKAILFISLLFLLGTIPTFYLIAYGNMSLIIIGLTIFSVLTAINAAIIPGLLSEIIPINVRYTILAFSFNIGFGIFGGIVPFLGLLLINKTKSILAPSLYLTLIAIVTLIAGCFLKNNARTEK